MDQKIWLWRKKSTEKTSLSTDKQNISQNDNGEETLVTDKRELENELNKLNHKLASALSDCSYKDELVKKHENTTLQATAGREKAESIAASLTQELDEALQLRVASEERVTHLDAALKECMRQLRFVRQEQEQRIHEAVMNASKDFENSKKNLEEQLAETRKRVTKLGVENTNISKALLAKENVIDDLNKQRARIETDLSALLKRLESTEKDNAALKYEVRVLEKELEIWNEEREFNRRTAEASHKQHLESVKKIAKLESECQRLHVLVCKWLPGPDALAKMKNEVGMLGKGSIEMRRKLNQSPTSLGVDFTFDNYSDSPSKRVNTLTKQLCAIEEENMALKEALNNKTSELQFSRAMYARAASKLSEVESRLEESSKSLSNNESTRNSILLSSMSDVGIDDKASCAESWASALISELGHFRNEKIRKSSSCKTVASSEINLMYDFVEMEKLALVSVDELPGSSHVYSGEASGTLGPLQTGLNGNALEVMCKEMVLVPDNQDDHSMLNNEMKSKSPLVSKVPGPLQDIPKANLEQTNATQRNTDEILEDIRRGLACMGYPNAAESFDEKEGLDRHNSYDPSCISSYMSWKPLNGSSISDSCNEDADVNICSEEASNQLLHPDLNKSICRIIELIEGISLPPPEYNIPDKNSFPYKHTETPSGYVFRVFQWKTSEIGAVLQEFVQACYDLLNGKTDIIKFTQELTSGLDWIINHCFSFQDVWSMRDAIKNHFDWDESESDSEVEGVIVDQFTQPGKFNIAALYDNEELNMREEKIKARYELVNEEATKQHLEDKLQSTMNRSNSLINQLEESEKAIEKLQVELDTLRKAEEMVEVKVEKQIWTNEIYDNPLCLTKYKIDEDCQNFPSEDLEPKINNSCHEKFETTGLDTVTEKELPKPEIMLEGNQFRTDQEITIASEKLAECQETILNLGKKLKALASPKEAALFENVISAKTETITPMTLMTIPTPPRKKLISRRPSLLDQMIIEDQAKVKGNPSSFISRAALLLSPTDGTLILDGNKQHEENATVKSLAIVPSRKQGGSLWKKLFRRKGFGC
ncbi:filament-like plant protein 7-like isoform X3 [Hibiscus syriacus]|uniref:Filament-like plant protein 7-like isoform X3 n=1 Tax=Hibiscus syriacus TaxID=106335 RepID=A0A6A3AXM7_HIBSY|nr:filament-like plant protein 7 [Hibiscus syriacus]KAE8709554.1 filament-like plant protein 7-like isoform X3 [Hibiscus syriacus]